MGSKNRIAKFLLPIILKYRKQGQYYVEPFVGGANMIDKVIGNRIAGELNKYVCALLKELSLGWIPPTNVTEEQWFDVKNNKDKYPPHVVGYFGICLSFGAVWFACFARDKKGNRDFSKEAYRNLLSQAHKLRGVEFHNTSYESLPIPPKSIIYCDPPYIGTDKYRGFEGLDHEKFWEWCRQKTAEGHLVYISEFVAPDDFVAIWKMEINTQMSEKALGKNVTECLFVHKSLAYLHRDLKLN